MNSTDPLAPGSPYTASVDDQGKVGHYRLEVDTSQGTGKLNVAGGAEGTMKEPLNRACAYMQGLKVARGIGQQIDTTEFRGDTIDLLTNRVPCESGIALIVAIYSALKPQPSTPGLLALGDLSIQGNIKFRSQLFVGTHESIIEWGVWGSSAVTYSSKSLQAAPDDLCQRSH